MNPMSVIVCDDHFAVRGGIRLVFQGMDAKVVGECDSVKELLELVEIHPDAVVITDLAMNNVPFHELVIALKQRSPECKVVVYSMRESLATIKLCYEAGAMAFVTKRDTSDELIKAVTSANVGARYVPPMVGNELAKLLVNDAGPLSGLLPKEREAFLGYVRGESIETLVTRLSISDRSVQNLLSSVARKLDTPRALFQIFAHKHGMIERED